MTDDVEIPRPLHQVLRERIGDRSYAEVAREVGVENPDAIAKWSDDERPSLPQTSAHLDAVRRIMGKETIYELAPNIVRTLVLQAEIREDRQRRARGGLAR